MFDSALQQGGARSIREYVMNDSVAGAVEPVSRRKAGVEPEWVLRQPKMGDAPLRRMLHQDIEHGRMQMEMEVAVDVIELESGRAELFKLGRNFIAQLGAQLAG